MKRIGNLYKNTYDFNNIENAYNLYHVILPCLLDVNVAIRKGLGTNRGVKLAIE